MLEQGLGGLGLGGRQRPVELHVERPPVRPLIVNGEAHAILLQQDFEIVAAAPREGEVFGELLRARDHAGRQRRG